MTGFVTVFEITRWSNGILAGSLFDLLIGVAALIGSATALFSMWRRRGGLPRRNLVPAALPSLFILGWAVVWLTMGDFPRTFRDIEKLAEAYASGRYELAEGTVTVLHRQPAQGHASGDRIVVAGRTFEINYFYATPAYRQTIAHGGALQAGTQARIGHVDGAIVRVDIRQE